MTPPVSVPEKTLEHWSSQFVAHRFGQHVSQWWPAAGEDIDVRLFPATPGVAVQIELKTTTPAGPGLHDVTIDLGQLWEYSRKPPGEQPFYAFPRPHWDGDLRDAAMSSGRTVRELARKCGGSRWWFAKWMVVLTTAQVAAVLDAELAAHGSPKRKVRKRLVRFDTTRPGVRNKASAVWGDLNPAVTDPGTVEWLSFWAELQRWGRPDWPQLIRLPAWAVQRVQGGDRELVAGNRVSGGHVAALLWEAADLPEFSQGDRQPFVTLTPDSQGNYLISRDPSGAFYPQDQAAAEDDAEEPEDNRQAVFIGAERLYP